MTATQGNRGEPVLQNLHPEATSPRFAISHDETSLENRPDLGCTSPAASILTSRRDLSQKQKEVTPIASIFWSTGQIAARTSFRRCQEISWTIRFVEMV